MRVTIIKPFPFSTDGVTALFAVPGEPAEIPDALIAGLTAEGFVSIGGDLVETEDAPTPAQPDLVSMRDADLRAAIKAATGTAPGPRTSRATLIEQYRALTKAG